MAKMWDRWILLITKMANKNFRIADFRSQATRISIGPWLYPYFEPRVASQIIRRRSFDTSRMGRRRDIGWGMAD